MHYCKKFCCIFNITLFFVIAMVYFYLQIYNFFYPGSVSRYIYAGNQGQSDFAKMVDSSIELKVSVHTKFLIHMVDESTGFSFDYECPMPNHYIGMTRDQFEQALETFEKCPPLSEREQGFDGLEMIQFSDEIVTLKKYYKSFTKVNLKHDDL